MKIKLEKQVSEVQEVEIDFPAYFKNTYRYLVFSEKTVMEVGKMIAVIWDKDDYQYKKNLSECLTGGGDLEPCTESEFNRAYIAFLEKANEIANIYSLQNAEI